MNIKYHPIASKLFIDNRKKFITHLKPKSIAIFNSNDEMPRSGDQNFTFQQNRDLFYLSGIDQEDVRTHWVLAGTVRCVSGHVGSQIIDQPCAPVNNL